MTVEAIPFPGLKRALEFADVLYKRAIRVAGILGDADISYAVVGGFAVSEWVGRVDQAAVRFTKDIDILVRRADVERIKSVMESAGFIFGTEKDVDFFKDGSDGSFRDGVHLLYSGERFRPDDPLPTPDVAASQPGRKFQVVNLLELVTMELTAFRLIHRVHIRDMIDIGLIDASWPAKFPSLLAARLQEILDDPNG